MVSWRKRRRFKRKKSNAPPKATQQAAPATSGIETVFAFEAEKGFMPYSPQDLYDELVFKKLKANARIHVDPDHQSRRVGIRKNKSGTRYFQRYPSRENIEISGSAQERETVLHRLHIDYALDKMKGADAIAVITAFDQHHRPIERKMLRDIRAYKWQAECAVAKDMIPDLIGRPACYLAFNLGKQFSTASGGKGKYAQVFEQADRPTISDKSLNYAVAIEVINQSPPTAEKWRKLVRISAQHNVLVVFNIIVDADPESSRSYFRYDRDHVLVCAFYMRQGLMFKNGVKKPNHYDHTDFAHEVTRLQKTKDYAP